MDSEHCYKYFFILLRQNFLYNNSYRILFMILLLLLFSKMILLCDKIWNTKGIFLNVFDVWNDAKTHIAAEENYLSINSNFFNEEFLSLFIVNKKFIIRKHFRIRVHLIFFLSLLYERNTFLKSLAVYFWNILITFS